MRPRRFRPTIRGLMLAVALVAVAAGGILEYRRLARRSAEYRARAADHAGVEESLRWVIATSGPDAPVDISPGPGRRSRRFTAARAAEHEAALRAKYERAARRPWLSVAADPPFPDNP